MSIVEHKHRLENIADGKIFYIVLRRLHVPESPSRLSQRKVQLFEGTLLSKRPGTHSIYNTLGSSKLEHYQIEDNVGTYYIDASPKEIYNNTKILDIIQAGILMEIKDLHRRIDVFHHTLTRAVMAMRGDRVIVDDADHEYMIESVYPRHESNINVVFEVSRVTDGPKSSKVFKVVSADRINFLESITLEDYHSHQLSIMNTEENIWDKRNVETLSKNKVSRNSSIMEFSPELSKGTKDSISYQTKSQGDRQRNHDDNIRKGKKNYGDSSTARTSKQTTLKDHRQRNSSSSHNYSLDGADVEKLRNQTRELGISSKASNARNELLQTFESSPGSSKRTDNKRLKNIAPSHAHEGFPVLVKDTDDTLHRGCISKVYKTEEAAKVTVIRSTSQAGTYDAIAYEEKVYPYSLIYYDTSESIHDSRNNADVHNITPDIKSASDVAEYNVWSPRDNSKGSKRSDKADSKKQSTNSYSQASSSPTTDEATLQLLDSIQKDTRVVIMDGSNRCGIVTDMKSHDFNADRCDNQTSSNNNVSILVEVELDNEPEVNDREWSTYIYTRAISQYFTKRKVVVPLSVCRAITSDNSSDPEKDKNARITYGDHDSPIVEDYVPPPSTLSPAMYGRNRGIQGYNNSCYLDCTLFSMFLCNSNFDEMLRSENYLNSDKIVHDIHGTLSGGIVNCLRKYGFVRADRVYRFRQLLDETGLMRGLLNEEKDPEEFINFLMKFLWPKKPLLELKLLSTNNSYDANILQILGMRDPVEALPTLQRLYEKSMVYSDIKFTKAPKCLILQLPRNGQQKVFDKIFVNLTLDISNQVESYIRRCILCNKIAKYECKACSEEPLFATSYVHISYCENCYKVVHSHPLRQIHASDPKSLVKFSYEHKNVKKSRDDICEISKIRLSLFAVICISVSHYVAFVRCGNCIDSQWCFFDSMSDRDGHNIPHVGRLYDVTEWLRDHDKACKGFISETVPDHMRRLFSDAYICMYTLD